MPRKKSKRGGVALGFFLTVGILSAFTFVLVLESGPSTTVVQIPDTLPSYSGILHRYAPNDALQVSFDNLTAIRAVNQSVITNQQFFELDQPRFSMNTTAISSRLTIALSFPNATVTVVTVDSGTFANLTTSLSSASTGSIIPTDKIGNLTAYAAAGTQGGETQAYWLTVIPGDRTLLYSPGANDALMALQHVADVYLGSVPSILSRTDVDRMLYAVNGTEGHLALGIQNFPGSVQSGQATLISADASKNSALISYVVRFNDANDASAQVGTVRSAYISAHQFFQYDELVKAVEVQPVSQLKVAVGLVG